MKPIRPGAPLAALAATMSILLSLPVRAQDGAPAPAAPAPAAVASFAEGRAYSEMFFAGRTDELWAKFTPQMKGAMGNSVARLREFRQQVIGQLGAPQEVVSEQMLPSGEFALYARTMRMAKAPTQRFVLQWAVGREGEIGGMTVREAPEAAPTPHLAYRTKTDLQLPVEGEWFVVWGGRTVDRNQHAVDSEQRFAYDLLVRRDGRTHANEGKALTDYYCFGQPVYAPGAGIVAKIVDGVPDNAIGTTDPRQPAGNHVIIDHLNGEFSILAHLQHGSVKVATDDVVKQGDPIGACGNSGNTSEPHLHYQLQNAAAMFTKTTLGLPAQFRDYVANGTPVARGEPTRGQTVSRAKQ